MKRFIVNILAVLLLSGIIPISLSLCVATGLRRADFKLPPETRTIALGPSTTGCALNEKHIPGFKNFSRNGTDLEYLTPLLPRILDENPQMQTVWIAHGRLEFSMERLQDSEKLQKIRDKLPFIFYDVKRTEWNRLLLNPDFYGALLNPDLLKISGAIKSSKVDGYGFGYCSPGKLHRLHDMTMTVTGIVGYDKRKKKHGSDIYPKSWILKNRASEDYYSKLAIEICKQHNVTPVLFFTPLYQYDRWCTWDGFCEYMKEGYDPDLLIADYEDFQFPDDSYYLDINHLNEDGADYFTSYIAEHGLNAIPLKDWLATKGY